MMDSTHTTFRRLASQDADRFRPWYSCPALKIGWIILLVAVCTRWITR
jgi:hypothetical protein